MKTKASKKAAAPRVADQILAGLREAIAFERGELAGARVDRIAITARHAAAEPVPEFKPARIIDLRRKLGVSQTVFADALNVSSETVKAWEQGKNSPGGPALRLLEIAEESPAVVLRKVQVVAMRVSEQPGSYKVAVHSSPKAKVTRRRPARKNQAAARRTRPSG